MITIAERDRLLNNILGTLGRTEGVAEDLRFAAFKARVANGWLFEPELDLQDIATIARIASGEAWQR